jgi:hypothetical protein
MKVTGPAFIIAGASFSGAEILHQLLSANPAIFFPKGKPSGFFYRNDLYAKGIEAYQALFNECDPHRVPGDMGVQYFERGIVLNAERKYLWQPQEDSGLRIKRHCPEAKIILCLRNPLMRAALQFGQAKASRIEKAPDLPTAFAEELEGKRSPETHPLCYLYRNRYAEHIGHWKRLFGAANIRVFLYESMMTDLHKTLTDAAQFIGVRPHKPDAVAILRAQEELPPALSKVIEVFELFPSLAPLLNFGISRFAQKRKPEAAPLVVGDEVSSLLAEDRAKLKTQLGLENLDMLWAAPDDL